MEAPSLRTATSTTSRSARNLWGRYISAPGTVRAAARAKSRLVLRLSPACSNASGAIAAHSSTKLPSSRRACKAPLRATPPPFWTAARTKLRSPRNASDAPETAEPLFAAASRTKSRSPRSAEDASIKLSPFTSTACRMSCLSARSASAAYCRAPPRLASTAAHISSRSPQTSGGALASCFQSSKTAVRQETIRQLFRLLREGTGRSSSSEASRAPCLAAADSTPCMMATDGAIPASSISSVCRVLISSNEAFMSASSRTGRSFFRLTSFLISSADFFIMMADALTAVRYVSVGMFSALAAYMRS
mmetsp:Transcript_52261/g.134812  ORF Transcript_52261/g.134812 Transcript_52261/m.134812 type:complete len:305 (+) Transcript_52261:1136-2050(+)